MYDEEKSVEIIASPSDTQFIEIKVYNEEHTLANLLVSAIRQSPDVLFCAYRIDHPFHNYFRIAMRTKEGVSPVRVVKLQIEKLSDRLSKIEVPSF